MPCSSFLIVMTYGVNCVVLLLCSKKGKMGNFFLIHFVAQTYKLCFFLISDWEQISNEKQLKGPRVYLGLQLK